MRELIITDLEAEILAAEGIHPCTAFSRRSPLGKQEEHAPASDGFEKSAAENALDKRTPETKWEK